MKPTQRRNVALVTCGLLLLSAVAGFAQGQKRGGGARRPVMRELVLPAGTPVEVRLLSQIDSGQARDGDTFTATLAAPLTAQGRNLVAKDAQASGRVVKAVSSGRLKKPASLTLELVQVGGYNVRTEPVTLDGKSHAGRNTALIGGGAAAGAIIGAIAGGGKGAAIGAAAGAGAGTATAYLTGKQELVLPVEMAIRFLTAGGAGGAESAAPGSTAAPQPAETPGYAYAFRESDRRIISNYLNVNRANLPPGLARRERLPPGLERQLQRNGTLPPGLQKRVQPFPPELNRQLPPLPTGVTRVFLGNRAILLDQAQRILDLFAVEE